MNETLKEHLKDALYIAASQAYESEVVQTEMALLIIGCDKEFESRLEWINIRVQDWLAEAAAEHRPAPVAEKAEEA